jgi:hypothetical protein
VSVRAVALVPSAPLLVPSIGTGAGEQEATLRAATIEAVAGLASVRPEVMVVAASVASAGVWDEHAAYDFGGFGVQPERIAGGSAHGGGTLPWELAIGAWLLDETGWAGPRRYLGIAEPAPTTEHRQLVDAESVAVVVVGDGSARRSERAPGYRDPRAEQFDNDVAAALADGRPDRLEAIDANLAAELMCSGWRAWAWIATIIGDAAVSAADTAMHVAPYGVGYFVAEWSVG